MRSRRRPYTRAAAVVGLMASTLVVPAVLAGDARADTFTEQTLHFAVKVGPALTQSCDVVGIVVTPSSASSTNKVPAILTTNGFGGSLNDQIPFAEKEAALGYLVLTYSGLGFGGSGCKITLDDPDYDGQAAKQLVSYLGGAPGIAFTDAAHTVAAPTLNVVKHDAFDHSGVPQTYDPRVGMWGGSYGGGIQFATASVDPRVDTIIPVITWNDLSYSLGPNNTGQTTGVSTDPPGAVKATWALGFSATGMFDGAQGAQGDPSRFIGCPNFADWVCPALVTAGTQGYLQPIDVLHLRHASVASFLNKIKIPVLLDQGEVDTLFNLNEVVATFNALKGLNVPVSMLWRLQGHSGGTPSAAGTAYENQRIQIWLDHYLKGVPGGTGTRFAYYRDWTGTFAEAGGLPTSKRTYYLTSGNGLTTNPFAIHSSTQVMTTIPAGAPSGLSGLDAVGGVVPVAPLPDTNFPGAHVQWATPPLAADLNVVGSPVFKVKVDVPTSFNTSGNPAGMLVVFAKVYDVAPDGTASLINGLVAPVRVADPSKPFTVTLPGIVHKFAVGHSIEIMIAGGDVNYRGGVVPFPVTVSSGSSSQQLQLPTVAS